MGAYKSLLKEKEALEKSLAASTPRQSASKLPSNSEVAVAADGDEEPVPDASAGDVASESVEDLRARIMTLTEVVSTVTQERTSMAALFAADKKAAADAQRVALDAMASEVQPQTAVFIQCAVYLFGRVTVRILNPSGCLCCIDGGKDIHYRAFGRRATRRAPGRARPARAAGAVAAGGRCKSTGGLGSGTGGRMSAY